jgi:iron complex outermembrane receptor protein
MSFRRTPLAAALAAALASLASAAAHAQSVTPLDSVVITATPLRSELLDLVSPVNLLQGQGLRLKQQQTLGETLGSELGISSTYFGPNASRPVIRGLDGDRIRLLQNGVGVLDASAASFDHAVSLEPLLVDRIEVVRGPAALLYGGNAVGGVVNSIDGRIPQQGVSRTFQGAVDLRYGGADTERAGAFRADMGNDRVVLHVDAFSRRTDDLRIPDYQRSPQLRAADPLPPGEEERRGRLPNSDSKSDGGAAGLSVMLPNGYIGTSYAAYDSDYGTVAEEDVRIDLRQRRWDVAGELRDLSTFAKSLRFKLGHSDYRHDELEGGEVGTRFTNKGYDSRVELEHGPLGPFRGAFGVQYTDFDFSALGDEAYVPSTTTRNTAGFIYEETTFGPWKLSFGGRIERARVEAQPFEAAGLPGDSRRYTPWSGSAGVLYSLSREYGVAFNYAYTERAPTFQELYADGPHLATNAFEIGDRALGKEKSNAFDLSLRKQAGGWTGSVGVFYNRFKDFVTLLPSLDPGTGEALFRDAEDRSLPAVTDPDGAGYAEPIQQFTYQPIPAEFRGIEAQATLPVWSRAAQRVDLELRADYTRAKNRDNDESLPRIPPLRFGGALVYSADRLGARLDVLRAQKQDRVPDGEFETDGYTMVNASATYRIRFSGVDWEAFLRGINLLDEDARLSTSFLRNIAPLGRRTAMVGLRAAF